MIGSCPDNLGSLESIATYLSLDQTDKNLHDAKYDTLLTLAVLKGLKERAALGIK